MKKKILVIALCVILFAIGTYGTFAFFSVQEQTHNIITTNGVNIAINEWTFDENGELKAYPEAAMPILPGLTVDKIVGIKALDADAYVRVKLDITVTDGSGNTYKPDDDEVEKAFHIDFNTENWVRRSPDDGWWYLEDKLVSGEESEPLFRHIEFSAKGMKNEYINSAVEVAVIAQGVQAKNNGTNALNCTGWPTVAGEEG